LAVLSPERAPALLTTLAEKLALLERRGVSACIVLHTDAALLAEQATDFLASLVAHCRPRFIVEGPDFHFGHARQGTIATLREYAAHWQYEVHVVPAVHCTALPTHPVISSSSIRQALRDGRVSEANAMLGRPYRVTGVVRRGAGRGRGLGFPTANLERIAHLLPQEAVYACVAQLADGRLRPAAVNVGPQPTFRDSTPRVEAHLLDCGEDLLRQPLGLYFLARLREQQQFASAADLSARLQRDVAATAALSARIDELHADRLLAL
jgi:riboflavin kinase/FMN adenylyltransferase